MTAEDKTITLFTTRLRQLILEFEQLKQENKRLREEIAQRDGVISDVDAKLKSLQENYDSLMTAKMLEVNEGDMEAAKARLSRLIKSVNRCITMLSEK